MASHLPSSGGSKETKRQRFEILRAQLQQERTSFRTHWQDLGDYILPRRPRFVLSDANRGERRNQKIIDSTATMAARTQRAGMMGGMTSPARPWKRLTVPDPDLAEIGSVKEWLDTVNQRMDAVFLRSNLYNALPMVYGDLGVFATSAMMIEEDFKDVIRVYVFPIGSYYISTDHYGRVNVFFREFRMTVRQVVDQFAEKDSKGDLDFTRISQHVRMMWERGQRETWIDVCHVIQPNDEWDRDRMEAKHKRYSSSYYEKGTAQSGGGYLATNYDTYLRESGYDYFPVLCPRWETTGEDIYGTECPGMTALGDIRALQTMQKRLAQAVEKMVNPPMTAPTALRTQKNSILPGDVTFVDVREGQQGFKPAHEVDPRVQGLMVAIQEHQARIRRAFYEDLFLMLANTDRREITAKEIEARYEEKLLALGPVLEQLNQDLLDPLIDITFDIMVRQGLVPEPPEELQGVDLKVEYVSIMAQAQKLVGISTIERFSQFAIQIAAVKPEVLDKWDGDQTLDVYADALSLVSSIVRTDEAVAQLREARNKAQQAAQMAERAEQVAGAAKNLSQANLDTDNALARILKQGQAGQLVPA